MTSETVIDETRLADFRERHLSAPALLKMLREHIEVLVRVPIGVGKSRAADALLRFPGTYDRFDLVVYTAPTWNIINERSIVSGAEQSPVTWIKIAPRPRERCGSLNEEWTALERRGCAAHAKATLCGRCPSRTNQTDPCNWPHQLQGIGQVRLIFCAEQQFVLHRSLLNMLKARTRATRVLLVIDEARFLDTNFEVTIPRKDIERFQAVLDKVLRPGTIAAKRWRGGTDAILAAKEGRVRGRFRFPAAETWLAEQIQHAGINEYGDKFRYIGYDLAALQWVRGAERWKDDDGTLRFVARPYVGCHLMLLSAHLDSAYAGHRLGKDPIPSPLAWHRFRHSGTRIFNIRSAFGAAAYFPGNKAQILDTFALLLRRNLEVGRTSLLISRKKLKEECAAYLKARLAGWELDVKFVTEDYDRLPATPDPRVIPIIHYGVLGVNDFTDYQGAYCLNSYYISSRELNNHVQEAEPDRFRDDLTIVSKPDALRRVEMVQRDVANADRTELGNVYLRKLERDPVIQAAGRVRFLTMPREVVFFQMDDLHRDVGDYVEVRSLGELQDSLGLQCPKELDHARQLAQIEALRAAGMTNAEVAKSLKISPRTLYRRLRTRCAKNPLSITIREFDTESEDSELDGGRA